MPSSNTCSPRNLIASAFTAFAAFGAFWGVWAASLPRIQDRAGVTNGQLGLALLFVGAGAVPSMLLTGRALDRWGLKVAALVLGALGLIGAGLALAAGNLLSLCMGLILVGASSGAADVAMNSVAGRAEEISNRPVITRAHGVFSSLVVLATLGTGLATAAALPLAVPFIAVAVLTLIAGALMLRTLPPRVAALGHHHTSTLNSSVTTRPKIVPLMLVGVLGALAFASENAHQSWSAIFAIDQLHSSTGLASVAPAIFAATVAITRFSIGGLKPTHAQTVLLAGAAAAATGAVIIAAASSLFVAALGLAVAAAGTAALFPTLLGIVSRNVDETSRGRATSIVTTVSYLGFLLGPVYVGLLADATGLRGAMVAVAALAVALFALTPALLRLSGFGRPVSQPHTKHQPAAFSNSKEQPVPRIL
jgi:predicted MFS family arabinose efflux permease